MPRKTKAQKEAEAKAANGGKPARQRGENAEFLRGHEVPHNELKDAQDDREPGYGETEGASQATSIVAGAHGMRVGLPTPVPPEGAPESEHPAPGGNEGGEAGSQEGDEDLED